MRPDLKNVTLRNRLPLYPIDLATAGFIWQCRKYYENGFLQYELDMELINQTGQYVHSGFFIKNYKLILDAWDYAAGRDFFDFNAYAVDTFMVDSPDKITDTEEKLANTFVKLYLSTLKRTILLGYHYSVNSAFLNHNKEFSRKQFTEILKFDINQENPFVLMVDNLAYDHRWIAMFGAFMATAPNGYRYLGLVENNSEELYRLAVPNSDLEMFHQVMYNPIPKVDWMN